MTAFLVYLIVFSIIAVMTIAIFRKSGIADASSVECSLGFFTEALCAHKRRNCNIQKQRKALLAHGLEEQAEVFSFLSSCCCTLPVRAKTVNIINGASAFYAELKSQIEQSERSIVISSLYIGDGPLAQQLVTTLQQRVIKAQEANQEFEVCILLDYNRMHNSRNMDTVSQLLSLPNSTASSHVRVRLFLFQSPCCWNTIATPFGRVREALGVQHTKIFCFDGRCTLLTGANLSDDYFTTRIDRYVVISDNERVAEWFSSLVEALCDLSYPVKEGKKFGDNTASAVGEGSGGMPQKVSSVVILPNVAGVDPSTASSVFSVYARTRLRQFAVRAVEIAGKGTGDGEEPYDTFLFPTIQCARANVFHDSAVLRQLFCMARANAHIFLMSPYLNIYSQFLEEIMGGSSRCDLITASASANGWRTSRGISRLIPLFYLQLQRFFFNLTKTRGCSDRVKLWEFNTEGMTFHAKGLWFTEKSEAKLSAVDFVRLVSATDGNANDDMAITAEGQDAWSALGLPYLVAYGSTNYGHRSVYKDVEAEVFLCTTDQSLREALRQELIFLLKQSVAVTEDRFVTDSRGPFQLLVSFLVQMGRNFF
ncbi:putative phosphatidylglycerophosphate synthase-like protein [Trypanosoma vivax]|uniref:CDP-diacylglycerol--glycerol-3-phosphate 3-phosphatidyltransferase n=1 Tax=Trypanosoma vivax (strain Y486) TaxID=1055687 RepID=G0U0A7_TRYVY|nr:putative phosphatidylglycerophosphate synthase-like protein [Trypanosoma vivax]CCC49505.1 putative phosphatidylglycerophosphate synthase-like protein [Trypanosoma vivax Y486]